MTLSLLTEVALVMFPLNLPVYLSLVLLADHCGHVTYLLMFELYFQVRALFLTPSCQCDYVIVTNTYIYWGSGIALVPPAHCTCFVPMPTPCVIFFIHRQPATYTP